MTSSDELDHDAVQVATEITENAPALPPASQHHSLKHHLLGPSLTKAGQDAVDQKKVAEVINEASKGSKYFNNEEVKDKERMSVLVLAGLSVLHDRLLVAVAGEARRRQPTQRQG